MDDASTTTNPGRYGPVGLLLGLAGTGVLAAMTLSGDQIAAQAYLFGWFCFMALTLGFFGFTLLHHVVRGKWGLPVLRIFEAGASLWTFGFMAVLFLPILVPILTGQSPLYSWAHLERVASDPILHSKQEYLNAASVTIRFVCFFLLWIGLAHGLRKSTRRQDESGVFSEEQKRTNWAAPGLVAFFLSVTFAFTDWIMSLEPHWSSTMYGVWLAIGSALAALSLTVMIVTLSKDSAPYKGVVNSTLTKDLGNLMFALTMLWGYTSISQYLIIWSGNLPEYTSYFVNRSQGGWNAIGMALVLGQFFIPFMALITPRTKAVAKTLALVAGWILVMRLVDTYQLVMPAFQASTRPNPMPHWQDFVGVIGLGGLWVYAFSQAVKGAPLLPKYDARLTEADAHAH